MIYVDACTTYVDTLRCYSLEREKSSEENPQEVFAGESWELLSEQVEKMIVAPAALSLTLRGRPPTERANEIRSSNLFAQTSQTSDLVS